MTKLIDMTNQELDAEIESVLDEMYASMRKLSLLTNDRFGEILTGKIEDSLDMLQEGLDEFQETVDERRENEDES